ncbi:hypothetical protein PAECIP111892_01361 [Paenibacillus auburnensis]|uniref:Lipoprotein n=1 Tax=Paenibacillus auburnensis TaxID=2905649 RepID=A0ABN8FZK3_9BACL|nr:hypothetical protein [Paenibacillus auburnensis]CAH1193952.1 hypothetical protein PAECIP111892_01361 [Paenibacillus auburnensis]
MIHNHWKIGKLILMTTALAWVLGACSDKDSAATKEPENQAAAVQVEETERPEYLPKDFPLPDDAEITTSHSEQNDGKKSVLLIFKSQEKLDKLAGTYKQYFEEQGITDASETIDEKNLILQGDTDAESWSLIGGTLSTQEDTVELTLTWSEL